MSQEIDSNEDSHEGVGFSDGYLVKSDPMSSENEVRDIDFGELQ